MSIHSKTYALGPVLNYLMVLTGLEMKTVSEFYLCPPDALTFTLTIRLRPQSFYLCCILTSLQEI